MTETNEAYGLNGRWRVRNGIPWTIDPPRPELPSDCMRITIYPGEEAGWIAGEEIAAVGNYVSVLLNCHVVSDTPSQDRPLRTTCNLVLDESAVIPLIKTLALAGGTADLVSALNEQWQTPAQGQHSGPSKQVAWAVQNGASGRRPLELPPLNSDQSRLVLMEPEFDIVGDTRLAQGGWVSMSALRPFWMAEDDVYAQPKEVNLVLFDAHPLVALLLHAVGQPELAAVAYPLMGRANQVEPQEPPEANDRGLIERVLDAIDAGRRDGLLPPNPNRPVDANGSDRVVGITELVDAVMELNHYTLNERRRDYLTERVKIIAMELGAVDDLGLFPSLLSPTAFRDDEYGTPIPSHFTTLTVPGLEVPRELAEPYWEVQERATSLDEAMQNLRDEILDLRREYLTNALLNIEPALEHRTTTEARLQARGLPSRP